MAGRGPWLVGRGYDLALFIAPGLLGLAFAAPAALGMGPQETPLWAWLALVVCVDVAHVWASLYRVYLDPAERARRPALDAGAPLLVYGAGLLVHSASPPAFWTALAYLAVYHFVKQQVGFVALYRHRARVVLPYERRLDVAAVYAGTLVPVAYWHAHLPRGFSWFIEGDFLPGLPPWVMTLLWPAWAGVGLAWIAGRAWALRQGGWCPGKDLTMLLTWASWFVGIVALDVDFAFTATNVLLHGVPYMALVWAASDRRSGGMGWILSPRRVWAYAGLLLALALVEEGLWDATVWREHAAVFGDWSGLVPDAPWVAALAVPLLTVPQATHYLLDGYIWRMDGSNPGLRERLLGSPTEP